MMRVIVLPVAVKPVGMQLRVQVIKSADRQWLSSPLVKDGRSVAEVAKDIMRDYLISINSPLAAAAQAGIIPMESVGVLYPVWEPNLIVTCVLPMLYNDAAISELLVPWLDESTSNHSKGVKAAEPEIDAVQAMVIEYWRTQLMRTNAVFDFLPEYFTSYQVRAIYSSLWGRVQSDGNFSRWLRDAKGPDGKHIRADLHKDSKKARELVRSLVRDTFAGRVADLGIVNSEAIINAWPDDDKAPVGLSGAVNPLPELTTVIHPQFATFGAEIGAQIAYQDGKKGSPPNWHTRGHMGRVPIDPNYSVRPRCDYPINTFIS